MNSTPDIDGDSDDHEALRQHYEALAAKQPDFDPFELAKLLPLRNISPEPTDDDASIDL